jgi:hypothetical protein
VHGTYLATDEGLPAAAGQTYILPAGAFFDIRGGRIARVSNYYNLADWIASGWGLERDRRQNWLKAGERIPRSTPILERLLQFKLAGF